MSIVITVLDPRDQTINMIADRRRTLKDRSTGRVLNVSDNTDKILQLTDKIYLGMTGDLKCCLELHRFLMQLSDVSASSLMDQSMSWATSRDCCSFIITGINDDNELFAFYRAMEGGFELVLLKDEIRYVILTHKINPNKFFEQEFARTRSLKIAMEHTVIHTGGFDDSISTNTMFVQISK